MKSKKMYKFLVKSSIFIWCPLFFGRIRLTPNSEKNTLWSEKSHPWQGWSDGSVETSSGGLAVFVNVHTVKRGKITSLIKTSEAIWTHSIWEECYAHKVTRTRSRLWAAGTTQTCCWRSSLFRQTLGASSNWLRWCDCSTWWGARQDLKQQRDKTTDKNTYSVGPEGCHQLE